MTFPADEAHAQLVVKNTFFDLADEKPRCRSSSSLPPSLRLAGGCRGGKATTLTPRRGVGKAALSGAPSDASSVDTNSTAAETRSPEAELFDAEGSDDLSGSESPERPSGRWWAEARNPGATDTTRVLQMHMVQVQGIASVVQASLAAAPGVLRTQALRHECGWSLTAEVAVDMLQSRGVLLNRAKQAMLAASEHSSSVYVLGYQAEPFAEDDLGFSATLCDVQDTDAACWKYLETGCCRFQGRCSWHHPWCYTVVNVMLLPSAA